MTQEHPPAVVKCPACGQELARECRFCPACGARVIVLAGDATGPFQAAEKSEAVKPRIPLLGDQPRFTPGQLIALRYRIVALLGQGGMGEVYRADDIKLGQSVALKFLPAHVIDEPERLARFHGEVRIARQVSHPNVCRVYDIGEANGQPLLTMEYIDGEDLASLLKRIGRLPEEKGIELARQLCLGLAAAHDKGVLHRDLKPANVMLDGRGQVRITDFGLATFAEAVHDVRSGTPGYMAPEQLAGKEVSIQSDLFSLGLILYELFTGKRPFTANTPDELRKLHADSTPTKPSSHVSGLNPKVERVILRCLETEARRRPRSAYEVVAGLPGSDPLAAALAAGQTPSPQLVADAPVEGSLHPLVAASLLAGILIGMLVIAKLNDSVRLFRRVPFNTRPEVLADKARELIKRLGYASEPVADSTYGFGEDPSVMAYLRERDKSPSRWDALASGQPAAAVFWYRQSPKHLTQRQVPADGNLPGRVNPMEPPHDVPGMATVFLDLQGRLVGFQAVPRQLDSSEKPPDVDWRASFEIAGLKWSDFQERNVLPKQLPPVYADTRSAWIGVYPEQPSIPMRVEAATCNGKLVFFQVEAEEAQQFKESETDQPMVVFKVVGPFLILAAVTGGAVLAWRNWRLGRANRSGALRLAVVLMGSQMLGWLLLAHHSLSFLEEYYGLLGPILGHVAQVGGLAWLMYMALEPYVRRRWPWRIVGWNRLLDGRWRDALVGRDILIGGMVGVAHVVMLQIAHTSWYWLKLPPAQPISFFWGEWFTNPLAIIVLLPTHFLLGAIYFLFFLLLMLVVLRREWIAVSAVFLLAMIIQTGQAIARGLQNPSLDAVSFTIFVVAFALLFATNLVVLTRFGLLAFASMLLYGALIAAPLTLDYSVWYFGALAVYALAFGGLAAYAFVISLGNRPLVSQRWLGED